MHTATDASVKNITAGYKNKADVDEGTTAGDKGAVQIY